MFDSPFSFMSYEVSGPERNASSNGGLPLENPIDGKPTWQKDIESKTQFPDEI